MNRLQVFIIIYLVVATTCFASIFIMPEWYYMAYLIMWLATGLIVYETFQRQKHEEKEKANRDLDAKLHR